MTTFNLSLAVLKQQYVDREITPRQLVHALKEAAKNYDDHNIWIHILSDDELEPYLQNLERHSPETLPLYGVPFAIKDNIDLANIPTTAACPDFKYTPVDHATVVKLLIEAGAIPLGKTNLDQFATGLVGTRSPYGQGKNAFNPEYISGGSSAGSALATSLGLVSFALGTDTAGSGRVPAVLNNVIGHKPTKGLLSCTGVVPACKSLDCVSIFSLTAADAATVFSIAASYDKNDCFARSNVYGNSDRFYSGGAPQKFKFGVPKVLDFYNNEECQSIFDNTVLALEAMGGEKVSIDFSPFSKAAALLYEGPWVAERWHATLGKAKVNSESLLPEIATIIGNGNVRQAADVFDAQYKLAALKKECDELISNLDFVVTPTTPTVFKRSEIDDEPIALNSVLGTYTNFMNLLDYSATAIPSGKLNSGVHWGITVFGPAFNDIALLNLAAALQEKFGLPLGATLHSYINNPSTAPAAETDFIDVVVCGAHLEGQPLNWQLIERGAALKTKTTSSASYKLFALPDGKRPAMIRDEESGQAIEIEVWSVPSRYFGSFVANIPAPLGIGKVETVSGEWLAGFICEPSGLQDAKDITDYRSWRRWLNAPASSPA